jgi:dihydrofolate reductase
VSIVIAMIAAVAENGVIGAHSRIPWRLPSDLAHFKRTTIGKPVIMGRRQFETVGKPLPGRTNLVVSRRVGYQPEGVIVINDLDAAIEHGLAIAEMERASEVMLIGGGEIYAQAMARTGRLHISHVALRPEGDVFFPAIDPAVWEVVAEPAVTPSAKDEASYRIAVYERRKRVG